jgi:hypothetical protein
MKMTLRMTTMMLMRQDDAENDVSLVQSLELQL